MIIGLLCAAMIIALKTTITRQNEVKKTAATSISTARTDGPIVGDVAPNLRLSGQEGGVASIARDRRRQEIVGFFCGCDLCRAAAYRIGRLQAQGKLGVITAVISMDHVGARRFITDSKMTAVVICDPSDQIAEQYVSQFCPRLWVISASNIVVYRSDLAIQGKSLDDALGHVEALETHMTDVPRRIQ